MTCACGCGEDVVTGTVVRGHGLRMVPQERHGRWNGGRWFQQGYVLVMLASHPRANVRGYVREHIVVAETALGKPLPVGAEVHHVNGVRSDNANSNLVICQDVGYHRLLHQRARALQACGHADWRPCVFCKAYDTPEHLFKRQRTMMHRACYNRYMRERKVA